MISMLVNTRAHQLTERLLRAIREHRARVVVIDITGVADVDEPVANHLVQTVDASRLMGAGVIITGLSSEIAQTLVTIGVDLGKMNTVGDLQGGIEEAERLLGFTVVRTDMPHVDQDTTEEPLRVSILRHGGHLVASIHTALDDGQLLRFRRDLLEVIGTHRARGVIIDVAALDVIDSFALRLPHPRPGRPPQMRNHRRRHPIRRRHRHDPARHHTPPGAHRTRPRGRPRPPRLHPSRLTHRA